MWKTADPALSGDLQQDVPGSHLELGGSIGHHHTPDVILQRLHDELHREAALSMVHGVQESMPASVSYVTAQQESSSWAVEEHVRSVHSSCGLTPCLPRQNTKVFGSPFLLGSACSVMCVRCFLCKASSLL